MINSTRLVDNRFGLVAQSGRAPGFYSTRVTPREGVSSTSAGLKTRVPKANRVRRYPMVEGSNPPEPVCLGGNCMKEKEIAGREFKPLEHKLVPRHEILDESEVKKILSEYDIEKEQMPKIRVSEPAALAIKAKIGDVIRITRESPTAGKAIFYRLVIS